ncbi:MAG: histidine phosphatase family protein [Patescibacteria group bacterium]
MTGILLIRHGEIDNPQNVLYGRNIPVFLNDEGRRQIERISERIKKLDLKIDRIYTSPLKRAVRSAEVIAKSFGLKQEDVIIDEDLNDVDIPATAGKPTAERDRIYSLGIDEYSEEFVALGNESRAQVIERMQKAFKRAVSKNHGRTVALVSHGDPIQFLLFTLKHPGDPVPSMNVLTSKDYPPKGSAERVTVDEKEKVIASERIL